MNTLSESAAKMRIDQTMKDPERFLARQIKSGRIRGRKIGRSWMMTDADIEFAIEAFANNLSAPVVAEEIPAGRPSTASMRRRRVA